MKIKRKKLLNNLQDFALQGSGIIIGSPGIGKTYLLIELLHSLESAEIPVLFLPIDQLGDGTDKTLQGELSYEGDLIERLKSVPISDQKAILLFDAFDAARDERTRKNFLRLIQRTVRELKDSWNVLVTVRTYDAKKSQELLDLFGNLDDTRYRSENILCRHFTIPPFNTDEIQEALDQIGCPTSIYENGSQDFKNILATPFNLWLLEKILKVSPDLPDFSKVHSEVQLLGLFWQRRIESTRNSNTRLFVLEEIAHQMVKKRSLSIRQSDIRKMLIQTAWDDLLSDEILTKVSSSGQRIAFSHNILFDYAISVLFIDDEPKHLERFISEDPSRPLFLRPSLTYFFTRLWYYDSASFWKAFWHIFPSNQSVHLRLVARLIPTSVIANEARTVDQLTPILEKLQNGDPVASKTIARLLQSLRMREIKRDALWIDFFHQISAHLHSDFAWDLATLTSDILERATDVNIKKACGRIGRRLLQWIWQQREIDENDWYNRLGSYWAVPLVAKTYYTNVEKSRGLLNKVLKLTKKKKFPIDFLSELTEHVDKIWDCDPEFVTSVYRTVFIHDELSNEDTRRGGYIISFRTSRRQDYNMCEYRLIEHFPEFLQTAPSHATQAVIQSLNYFIPDFRIYRELVAENPATDLRETFNFRGKWAYFVQDQSHLWDAGGDTDEPIKIADMLFEFIGELTVSEESLPLLDSLLDIFRNEVRGAFFWKRFLKIGSQFPKVFASRLFELCIAEPIQRHLETSYELGLFLGAAAPEFTSDQRCQIEESILELPRKAKDEDNQSFLDSARNRLLAQIPMNLLQTDQARKIREQMVREDRVPPNQPPLSFSITSEPVTEEKLFQEKGVDTSAPENQELHRFFKPLDDFSSEWRNSEPTERATRLIFPHLEKGYATLKNDTKADEAVIDSLWLKLIDCVAILSRVANDPESSLFTFCRQILLEAAEHEQPKPNPDFDGRFNSWSYSPYPRHGAAQGLLRLVFHQPDEEILDAIEALADDPVPSVRMVTAMELTNVYAIVPQRFWHIMDKMAAQESNSIVQQRLYFALTRVAAREKENEDKTTHLMAKLLKRTQLPLRNQGPSDPFIDLLMWLVIARENTWASETIENTFFKNPIRFASTLNLAVSQAMRTYVVPKNFETVEGRERTKRAIFWVSSVITVASDEIAKLYNPSSECCTEEEKEKLRETYTIIETVIRCLYFAVGRKTDASEQQTAEISSGLRCEFYKAVEPLMEQVITFAEDYEKGIMLAKTAHYFVQVLTRFLSCDPKRVLHLAARVVQSSERFGYNLDSIAVRDVVEFVEIVLADYRHEVRDGESLEDLLNLLDMFAKTGWTDALKLVWRLDEVFR